VGRVFFGRRKVGISIAGSEVAKAGVRGGGADPGVKKNRAAKDEVVLKRGISGRKRKLPIRGPGTPRGRRFVLGENPHSEAKPEREKVKAPPL